MSKLDPGDFVDAAWQWRCQVRWQWRWVSYCVLGIVLFYVVEDFRGARDWKRFLEEHPGYGSEVPRSKELLFEHEKVWPHISSTVFAYANGSPFKQMEIRRDSQIAGRAILGKRKLWFPLTPFRRCGIWHPSSITLDQHLSETEAAELIVDAGEPLEFVPKELGNVPAEFPDDVSPCYVRILLRRSVAFAQLNQNELSSQSLFDAFRIQNLTDNGRSLSSSNDATLNYMFGLQLIWEGLRNRRLKSDDLARLQELLEAIDYQNTADESARFLAAEACQSMDLLKWNWGQRNKLGMQRKEATIYGATLREEVMAQVKTLGQRTYTMLMPNGWVDRNKAALCRLLDQKETPPHDFSRFHPYTSLSSWTTGPVLRHDPRPAEAYIRCAIAAVAVERFRIANDRCPTSLNELTPRFLDEVLLDPYSEDELIYLLPAPLEPVIYSVGPNLTDDKGTPRAPISDGDLVWRYKLPPGFSHDQYNAY